MSELKATRLLLTPICHRAPPRSPGDVVRVTDGTTTIYLEPADYDVTDENQLHTLLAEHATGRHDLAPPVADDTRPGDAPPGPAGRVI